MEDPITFIRVITAEGLLPFTTSMDFTSFIFCRPSLLAQVNTERVCRKRNVQIFAFWAAGDTLSPILPLPRGEETPAVHLKKKRKGKMRGEGAYKGG